MTDQVKHHDFVEVDYTGRLADGTVFDTTIEDVAKMNNFFSEKQKFGPIIICVGEQQILPGLDTSLIGKEIGTEFTITLTPEHAFGRRDIKNLKIVPMSTFKQHKMEPYPGLQIDVDGQMGTVMRISGGRVTVNFNHPLAGKEVVYEVKVHRKLTDTTEQIIAFLNTSLKVPADKISVELKEESANVTMPLNFPEQLNEMIGKKLAELTGLKEIKIGKKEDKAVKKE
ncbi:peptidylprolyl isomerase [Candidatus Woesearchaeota archaeon]|nr:peptidylprolyl isomerase [Candidatus Woesearchaeota archaeon]